MRGPAPEIPDFADRFETGKPPIASRTGVVVGALAAALASGALVWWLGGEDRGRIELSRPEPPAATATPTEAAKVVAAPAADPAQVRRAYDQVQATYAEGGAPGLAGFAHECAEALAGDPRILDYCLAFDIYASALAPAQGEAADWFRVGEARRLRLAREALPAGADPQIRLAEIQGLMRLASSAPPQATPAQAPPVQATPVRAAPAPVRKAVRAAPVSRCRFEPTPARRMICANPSLQAADRRMQSAYRQALAAGADRDILEGEQAAWRTARNGASGREEMADLYARRMGELAQHARAN